MINSRKPARQFRLWVIAGILVVITVFMLAELVHKFDAVKDKERTQLSAAGRYIHAQTQHLFDKYTHMFRAITESSCMHKRDTSECNQFFQRLNNRFSNIVNFAATDRTGLFFASGRSFDRDNPPSVIKTPFFKELAAGKAIFVMNPHIGPISGEMVTGLVIPLLTATGDFDGLIGVSIKLEELELFWQKLFAKQDVSTLILDRNQQMISTTPNLMWILEKKAIGKTISKNVGKTITKTISEGGNFGILNLAGLPFHYHVEISEVSEWAVITLLPANNSLLRFISSQSWPISLTLVLLLLVFLAFVLLKREELFINRLVTTEGALRVQRDNLESQVVSRTTELRTRERSFRRLFENAEVSIWNEDLSDIINDLANLRRQGVTDLRQYLEEHSEAAWEMVKKVRVNHVNNATLKLFGATSEEQLIWQIDKTFGSDAIELFIEALCSIWDGKRVFRAEADFLSLNGKELRAIISFQIPDYDEGYDNIPVTFLDITERKQAEVALIESEAKFRAIFELTSVGMVLVVDGENIKEWSAGAQQLFGYSKQEVMGNPITMLMPERYKQAHIKGMTKAIKQGGCWNKKAIHELVGLRKNGQEFPLELTLSSWKWHGALYFSAIVLDISERQQAEQSLRRAQKMDALGKLTGGIAHDFNNMLGIILGYTELLQSKCGANPVYSRYLKNIQEASRRSISMTDKLLSFSRKKISNAESVNLNQLIQNDVEMLAKSLTVSIEIKLSLCQSPWPVWLDKSEFQDVLLNLSINAQHAMQGHGTLTFKTIPKTLNDNEAKKYTLIAGDYLQLSVIDTGIGMDEETKAKIFDPFFTTKGEKGTGLGLSQVFGFVQRSGGAISVDSQLAQGTEFTLYFPRHQTLNSQNPSEEIIDSSDYSGHESLLVVDDEPALRDMLTDILSQSGYQVRMAEDGNHALKILAQHNNIVLMLSDVIMPNMDGFELANEVAKRYPHIKIQLASGFTDGRHSKIKDNLLYQNMLYKPYKSNGLLKRIRHLLDQDKRSIQNHEGIVLIDKHPLKLIEWTEQFDTGIDEIDTDHKKLVGLLNRCIAILSNTEPDKEMKAVLNQLQDYTVYHFQREENIMLACDYPHFNNHKQVHKLLINEVNKKIKTYELGNLTAKALLEFIWDWLNNHIVSMDRAITPYFQGKNEIKQALKHLSADQKESKN